MKELIDRLTQIEHGFKHIMEAGDDLLKNPSLDHFETAVALLSEDSYQGRMLATYLLGALSNQNSKALELLLTRVAEDPNWRVQEMLAKAVDQYCKVKGYEQALEEIRAWLAHPNPNVRRAVTEGLRIWTGRPYFKTHPGEAIRLLALNNAHASEYLRKSVGNALRDISRKHFELVQQEVSTWDLTNPSIAFTAKLVRCS